MGLVKQNARKRQIIQVEEWMGPLVDFSGKFIFYNMRRIQAQYYGSFYIRKPNFKLALNFPWREPPTTLK